MPADRDQSVEQLLKMTMRGPGAPLSAGCVDAEKLAAWSEGGLSADEAGEVELHLSTCDRCQAMMAVLARLEPAMPVEVPFWRRWPMGWLVPITVAAAALAIWIAVPARQPPVVQDRPIARVEAPVPPAPIAEPPVPAAVPDRQAARLAVPSRPPSPAQITSQATAPPAPARPPAAKATEAASTPAATLAAPAALAAESAARPAAPPPSPAPASSPVAQSADAVSRTAVAAGGAARTGIAGGRVGPTALDSAAATIVEIVAASSGAQAGAPLVGGAIGGGAGRGGGRAGGAAAATVAAPATIAGPLTRWRILPSGSVERSLTGGTTWESAIINPPAALTGGAAPSASVCWLIGRGGIVLRTVDGLRFDRVASPASVDLSAIRATDASRATVTTTDGRQFTTTDGGVSWR